MIIPRGAGNTIAVNLIVQNLDYQLKKLFTIEKGNEENNISQFRDHTLKFNIIDHSHIYIQNLVVFKDQSEIETLKRAFFDIIDSSRPEYAK